MKETKSKWDPVTKLMEGIPPLVLGEEMSHLYFRTPEKLFSQLSWYKFASKMIGVKKRVLDLYCKEGLGTFLLGKECGYALGVDSKQKDIEIAKQNYDQSFSEFSCLDIQTDSLEEGFDAIVYLTPSTLPIGLDSLIVRLMKNLSSYGLLIFRASSNSSFSNLERIFSQLFENYFIFHGDSVMIIPGSLNNADSHFIIGCKKD